MSEPQHTTSTLVVAGITLFQDEYGRYNLNALHHASEAAQDKSKAPNEWTRRKSTKALIAELQTQTVNLPLEVAVGGARPGTFAHEILAVEYAGWISPAFRIKVNQAFIDVRTGRYERLIPATHEPVPALPPSLHPDVVDFDAMLALSTRIRGLPPEQQAAAVQYVHHTYQRDLHGLLTDIVMPEPVLDSAQCASIVDLFDEKRLLVTEEQWVQWLLHAGVIHPRIPSYAKPELTWFGHTVAFLTTIATPGGGSQWMVWMDREKFTRLYARLPAQGQTYNDNHGW